MQRAYGFDRYIVSCAAAAMPMKVLRRLQGQLPTSYDCCRMHRVSHLWWLPAGLTDDEAWWTGVLAKLPCRLVQPAFWQAEVPWAPRSLWNASEEVCPTW